MKIKKQKRKIISDYEGTRSFNAKKCRKSHQQDIDQKLIEFVIECNTKGIPLGLALVKEKANQIAIDLNINDFNCSDSFISRFNKRRSIKSSVIHGNADGVPIEITNEWIQQKLPSLLKDYTPEDIYNGDEFCLFWRLLSNRMYKIRNNKFMTGKKGKERVSVFVCTNQTGSDKRKLLVIGKYERPRCFKNKTLPVIYRNNENSWMTSKLFIQYMKRFNNEMKRKNRNIVIIDNCPSHPIIDLSNIKMIFLPPNTTSVLQPMDAGVIHSIKSKYRLLLCRKLLALLEVKVDPSPKDFNLFDTILILNKSWSEVRTEKIENSIKKCGFSSDTASDISVEVTEIGWNSITESFGITGHEFQDFVTLDDGIITSELINQTIEIPEQS